MTIEFTAPIRIESANVTRDRHWSVRKRKTDAQREAVAYAIRALPRKAWKPPLTVTLTRIAPRALDDDNCIAGFKAVRDQIAEEVGIDDGDARLRWIYQQRRGRPKEYAVHVLIAAISSTV